MFSIGYNKYLGMKIPFLDYGQGSGYIPIEKKTIAVGGFVGSGVASSAWNALSTTGKVGVGAIGGGIAVGTYDWLFGKKATPITQNPEMNVKVEPDIKIIPTSQVWNQDFSNTWNIITNSPNAGISTEKKMAPQVVQETSPSIPFSVSPTMETKASQGTDWATLAAIAGVALVAYGYTSRKGGK